MSVAALCSTSEAVMTLLLLEPVASEDGPGSAEVVGASLIDPPPLA